MKTPQSGKKIFLHKIKNPSTEINFKRNNSQENSNKNNDSNCDITGEFHIPHTSEKPQKSYNFVNSQSPESLKKSTKPNFEALTIIQTTPSKKAQGKFSTDESIQEVENEEKGKY